MDKFIIRKEPGSKETEDSNNTNDNIEAGSFAKKARIAKRKYDDKYLAFGFSWIGEEDCPTPICVVCNEKLSNASMVPNKLQRHLSTKHPNLLTKSSDYFKILLDSKHKQAQTFTKYVRIAEKAQECSFLVAELVAKNKKSHIIAESLILPACRIMVKTMLGDDAEKEILKIPLSNNTISRRIQNMSEDIESQVTEHLISGEIFALQIDESTDISGKAQLMSFIRIVINGDMISQFFFCKELPEKTTGRDIFEVTNNYMKNYNLTWKSCISICTDGAKSMTGSIKGFVTIAKEHNPDIISTHCFLHREALISKCLVKDLQTVLEQVIKMVNFIKSRPQKIRMFSKLCEAMEADHLILIMHTEVRWLSKGRVLTRFYELREELLVYFSLEQNEYTDYLSDDLWCSKLEFLADLFDHLNQLNLSMQGEQENILLSTDKLNSFNDKLGMWKRRIKEKNLEMFPLLSKTVSDSNILQLITETLTTLEKKIQHYFPSLNVQNYDWVRNPFLSNAYAENLSLSLTEEQEVIEIKNDRNLKISFDENNIPAFWIKISSEFPNISKVAINILLPFSTSYLCEWGYSTMTEIKSKKRERLLSLEEELRVALSNIRPRIKKLCEQHQAQASH